MTKCEWNSPQEYADFLGIDIAELTPEEIERSTPRRARLKAMRFSDLRKIKEPVWLVPGQVPDGFVVVYGKPKRGKSFWVIELSLCVAAGRPFHGVELGKTGRALYVAAEGGAGQVGKRAFDVIKQRDFDEKIIEQNWELLPNRIDLLSAASVSEFLKLNPGPWALIVLDTLARNMDGDENSTPDMNDMVAACDRIRSETGAVVILVHHEGWSAARPRGSSALFGALDALIHVERGKDDGLTYVEVQELRDAAVPETSNCFMLENGVLELVSNEAKGVAALVEREQKMHAILIEIAGAKPVAVKQWHAAIEAKGLLDGKSPKTRDKQFERARAHMVKAGAIKITGRNVIPWAANVDGNSAGNDFSEG
jgi:AAA domain